MAVYEEVFPDKEVSYYDLRTPIPLDVEVNLDLHIDRRNLTSSRQRGRRDHMMDEVGRLAAGAGSGVLLLSYQKAIKYLSQSGLAAHWSRTAPGLNQSAPFGERSIEFAYWFAGRGLNKFTGRHVVALHKPDRPSLFEHQSLAALAPFSETKRSALAQHLRDTELLQMLHRGRQTNYLHNDPNRPRVILAFEPQESLLSQVNIVPPVVDRPTSRNSNNIHHQHALEVLASELFGQLGAVPHVCLSVLNLYEPSATEAKHLARAKNALRRAFRNKKRVAPHLAAWYEDEAALTVTFSPYRALDGRKLDRIKAGLTKAHLPHLKRFEVDAPRWPGGKTRVYAISQHEADEAIRILGGRT